MSAQFKRLLTLSGCVSVFVLAGIYFLNSQSTPGGYSSWSEWSICSKTCGIGLQGKIRKCNSPTPGPLGRLCIGPNVITRRCKDAPCPVHGGVSDWSDFGNCNRRCGKGVKKRIRTCTNPSPLFGGKNCEEHLEETLACNTHPCPVNGRFSKWSDFSSCQPDGGYCGEGIKTRTRKCDNPTPAFGGKQCQGAMSETHSCMVDCPTTSSKKEMISSNIPISEQDIDGKNSKKKVSIGVNVSTDPYSPTTSSGSTLT